MKVSIEPGTLAAAVKFAARALTARAAYPILGGLKITASDNGVEVSAFDHETSARAHVPADVGEPGTVLAPGRLLADICAQLPKHPVELTDANGAVLALAAGNLRYRLHLLPLDKYPDLPELGDPAGQADPGEFAAAIRQVVIAASRDDTLPALNAVQVTFTASTITMTATDRYRAALRHLSWQPTTTELPAPVLIPAPTLAEAAWTADSDPVHLHVLTGQDGAPAVAGFACGGQALTIRLTAGEYPSLAAMVPSEFAATALADAGELAEAVKRVTVVAARETPVHLAFTPGQVELTAGSGDEADGTDVLGCELDGDPITVAFHPRRLLDALTAIGAGRARISLTGPHKAALFTPATGDSGQDDDGPAYRHLLMPIRCAD